MNAENKTRSLPTTAALLLLALSSWTGTVRAQPETRPLPRLATQDGRHALFVDDAPFLILGAQCHNSSAWPAMLPKVWPAIDALHANTLEIPVYWEQFEPEPGRYDTSIVDTIIQQAREHDVRIVLLWFGTWKNGSSHYLPLWLKKQPEKCPRIIGKDGRRVDSPSPHSAAALDADRRAFSALLRHLKSNDPLHTVIMIQVENEPGSWNTIRDYSPEAQKLFNAAVPAELLKTMGSNAPAGGTWPEVFGANADEYFQAWSVARYIEQVAAAGKAENPLPMYVNVALRDPLTPGPAGTYESGGATDNVLWIWKAAAPSIDLLAPDIYQPDSARYLKVLDLYSRPDNTMFVPETMGSPELARMCFAAIGHGAIGWSPFGLDFSIGSQASPGEPRLNEASLAPVALNYQILRPIMREVARLNFEGKVQTVVEQRGELTQTMDFGNWQAVVTYGATWNSSARGNPEPIGRALVAKIGENEFLVTGAYCRVDFKATSGGQRDFVRVEEGGYEQGAFRPLRIWNGDETDWGLDFRAAPQALRVQLGTY
jgi:beta-galactosidase GanA